MGEVEKEIYSMVKIGDIAQSLDSGVSLKSKPDSFEGGTGNLLLKLSALRNGVLIPSEYKRIYIDKSDALSNTLSGGTILISRSNTPALVGQCALVETDHDNIHFPDTIWELRIKDDCQIAIGWLNYLLSTETYKRKIRSRAAGTSSSMVKISKASFRSISITYPPLTRQKKVIDILSTWDRAIEKLSTLIAEKKQKQKALMQVLLTGKKRFLGFISKKGYIESKLGLVPKDWAVLKARDLFKSVSIKNNHGEELLAVTQEGGAIPRRMLEGRVMSPAGSTKGYKLVVAGNFIISLRSFQGGLEYSEYRGLVSPAYTILEKKVELDDDFFRYFFKSQEFISRLSVAVIGIRDGKQISYDDFGHMDFRFPKLEEQQKIASVLNTASKELELLNRKLETLKEQKKGLMQQLLTGKKRLKF